MNYNSLNEFCLQSKRTTALAEPGPLESAELDRMLSRRRQLLRGKAETAKTWMQAHSEIELVSRDRGGDYATAASQGAPQAIQTADRFHLCVRRIGAYSIPFGERRG